MKKILEAQDVGLLKHLLEMELKNLHERSGLDVLLFMGVDGRIFSSFVPREMNPTLYSLFNLVKDNLNAICAQLRRENLKLSIQQYKTGTVLISGIGDKAFLVAIIGKELEISQLSDYIRAVTDGSVIIDHINELKPLNEDALDPFGYSDNIVAELAAMGRQLYKEKHKYTKDYKKNLEILDDVEKKLASVVGHGSVEEIITLTFNELGMQAGNMNRSLWMIFLDKVIMGHVARLTSPIVADQCSREWIPEIERKLRSFV